MHKATVANLVVISDRVVCIDLAAELHVLENLILQGLSRDVRHDRCPNLDGSRSSIPCTIVFASGCSDKSLLSGRADTARTSAVSDLATYEGFVSSTSFLVAAGILAGGRTPWS